MGEAAGAPAAGAPAVEGFANLVEIGRGGSSVVYSALDVGHDRRVALKVLNATGGEARRVEREARAVASLSDVPNVVRVHDVTTTDDGRPVLVMELMRQSLGSVLRESGPRPLPEVVAWLAEVAAALDRVHLRGVHHRDLKPDNVLLDAAGHAHLVDFGIAAVDTMDANSTTAFSFSPPYAPPERFTGAAEDGRPGDIYALAATFWALVVGAPPFGTSTGPGGAHGLINRVITDPVPCPAHVPGNVHAVFAAAMAKNPHDRYGTATSFAAALAAAAADPQDATVLPPSDPAAAVAAAAPADDPGDPDATVVRTGGGAGVDPTPLPATPSAAPTGGRTPLVAAAVAAALLLVVGLFLALGGDDGDEEVRAQDSTTTSRPDRERRTTTTTTSTATSGGDTGAGAPGGPPPDGQGAGGSGADPGTGAGSGAAVGGGAGSPRGSGPIGAGSGGAGAATGGGAATGQAATGSPAGSSGPTSPGAPPTTATPAPGPGAQTVPPPAPRPTSCEVSGGTGPVEPPMEILTNAPARIPLRATISCALNVGGRIGGSFSLDTNFESVGFYGGVAPTSGTIRWSDGQTTSFSGTAEVAFITLELTVSATTSGAWGGGSFSFKSPMHAVTQRIGDKDMVVSVTGMQGRFNWP